MTEKKKCDFLCGRDAVMQIRRLNLCEECADENLGEEEPEPRLTFEDVITLDGPT